MQSAEEELKDLMATLEGKVTEGLTNGDFTAVKREKLAQKQRKIDDIIKIYQIDYNLKAEELLGRKLNGKSVAELHSNVKSEVQKLFEMEIRQKFGGNQPFDKLVETLRAHFKEYWPKIVMCRRVIPEYKDLLERDLASGPFCLNKLEQIHKRLKENLEANFNSYFNGKPEEAEMLTFDAGLNPVFSDYKKENANKLVELERQYEDILRKPKNEYSEKMDKVLDENPNGWYEGAFKRRHENISENAIKMLVTNVGKMAGFRENLEKYKQVLQAHIDSKFAQVEDANRKNWEKAEDRRNNLGKDWPHGPYGYKY